MKIAIETIKEEHKHWQTKETYFYDRKVIVFTYSKEEIETFTAFLEMNKQYSEIAHKRNDFLAKNRDLIPYESEDVTSYGAGEKLLASINEVLEEAEMDTYYGEYRFLARDEEGNELKDISTHLNLLQSYDEDRWQSSYC